MPGAARLERQGGVQVRARRSAVALSAALGSSGAALEAMLEGMHSVHTVQRSWDMTRGAPKGDLLTKVQVRSLSSSVPVEVEASESMSVAELKERISLAMSISPRKSMLLRWYGRALEGDRRLSEYHIPEGACLELTLHPRSAAELEALRKSVARVRVRNMEGTCVIVDDIKPSTLVVQERPAPRHRRATAVSPPCKCRVSAV